MLGGINSKYGWVTSSPALAEYSVVQQYSEAATHAEHCGADRSTGAKEVTCSAAPGTAALAASPPADRLQANRSNTQDPCNIHTILPQRSHQTSRNHTSTPFIHHATTSQTDYENTFRQPCFPMLCTLCLELVGL